MSKIQGSKDHKIEVVIGGVDLESRRVRDRRGRDMRPSIYASPARVVWLQPGRRASANRFPCRENNTQVQSAAEGKRRIRRRVGPPRFSWADKTGANPWHRSRPCPGFSPMFAGAATVPTVVWFPTRESYLMKSPWLGFHCAVWSCPHIGAYKGLMGLDGAPSGAESHHI